MSFEQGFSIGVIALLVIGVVIFSIKNWRTEWPYKGPEDDTDDFWNLPK